MARVPKGKNAGTALTEDDPQDLLLAEVGSLAETEETAPLAEEVASKDHEEQGADTALVPYDSLQRYLAEIRRYPLLSPAEEHDLAVRYKEYGDIEAAYRLVTANLRLVVMLARNYQRAFRNLLDLIQRSEEHTSELQSHSDLVC